MQRASGREASVHACFMPIHFDRRECLIGLNCNARINNIEGSNHNNNAIACNNNNLNANHSYSLLQKMCARARKKGPMGG